MTSSPSHPKTNPVLFPNTHQEPHEDPFCDPPLLHRQQSYSSFLAAAIPGDSIATPSKTNLSTHYRHSSISLPSPGGFTSPSAPQLRHTSRYVFTALAVAFYASTIILTAAIVLVVRNATGSKNGRLRATGIIMGLIGAAGVVASGLAAWGMWKNEGRPRGTTPKMGIEDRIRIDTELRRLVMKNMGSDSAFALGPVSVPSPLFGGRRRRGRSGGPGRTGRSISAGGDHENISNHNADVENGSSTTNPHEEGREEPDHRRMIFPTSPLTISYPAISPRLSPTTEAQQQQQHHQDQDQPPLVPDQSISSTSPDNDSTSLSNDASNEHPRASIAWTHHLDLSTSTISSSSMSIPITNHAQPIRMYPNPGSISPPQASSLQDLSLLHALAADMGSEDESTRQVKRKRGLEIARRWGAVDDDGDEGEDEEEGGKGEEGSGYDLKKKKKKKEVRGRGVGGLGNSLGNGREKVNEGEGKNGNENGDRNANANANANGYGRRWGRVWGRKPKR